MKEPKIITQYFSKWRKCWVYFKYRYENKYTPNEAEINEFVKYKYKLR